MRRIAVTVPDGRLAGKSVVFPVLVDWFPRLTDDQILQNAIAHANGEPAPHPNPNLIEVVVNNLPRST